MDIKRTAHCADCETSATSVSRLIYINEHKPRMKTPLRVNQDPYVRCISHSPGPQIHQFQEQIVQQRSRQSALDQDEAPQDMCIVIISVRGGTITRRHVYDPR